MSLNITKFLFLITLTFLLLNAAEISNASKISSDPTFGKDGIIINSFSNDAQANKISIQNDGNTITVGQVYNGNNYDWAILKHSSLGKLDPAFGNNGKELINIGGTDALDSIQTLQNGKFIIGGFGQTLGKIRGSLARLNLDGTIDNTFGTNGYFINNTFNSDSKIINIVIKTNGRIVVIGYGNNNGNDDLAVEQLNSDGSLDSTFGTNGQAITPIGSNNDRGKDGVVQPDGKIVVLGDFNAGGQDNIFLARYNVDGSLDSTFGNDGIITSQIGSGAGGNAIALQPDGKFVVTGSTIVANSIDTYVARFNANGTPDLSFGNGGKTIHAFSNKNDGANAIILLPDGKMILGGYDDTGVTGMNFALMKFNANGTIDSSFGSNGLFTTPVGSGGSDSINSMVLQNNMITAVGYASNGNYNDWGIVRYLLNSVNSDLAVPLLKQISDPWQSQEYDTAHIWNPSNPTINAWGCAMTSAAMIFNYHGLNKLPDGTNLDPGTLNNWLKNQPDGYVATGWVNWLALARLSKLATSINNITSFDALEYQRVGGPNTTKLTNDLTNGNPDILEEPGHFIVAKGINGTIFDINDPYYNFTSLDNTKYNNAFLSLEEFIPAHTDLSYIMLVTDPNTDLKVIDSNGNSVGTSFVQSPIINPLDNSQTNSSRKFYLLPKPDSGKYKVTVTNNPYTLSAYLYDMQGNPFIKTFTGTGTQSFTINFDKLNSANATMTNLVTFESTIQDIKNAQNLHLINTGLAISLINVLENAKKQRDMHPDIALKLINDCLKQLTSNYNHPQQISSETYTLLAEDLNGLADLFK